MSVSPLSTLDTGNLQTTQLYSTTVTNIGTFYRAGNVVQFCANQNLNQGTTIAAYQTLKICDIPAGYRCVLPTSGRADQAKAYQGNYIPGLALRFYTSALLWSNLSGASITVPATGYWMETWLTNDPLPTS